MEEQNSTQPIVEDIGPMNRVKNNFFTWYKENIRLVSILYILVILGLVIFLLLHFRSMDMHSDVPQRVKVAVSLPMHSSSGVDIMNGIELAFSEANYTAGDVVVELVSYDDGNELGVWQEGLEEEAAFSAAADAAVVAYIGPFNSGAAKVSMPILNRAGIVQISPSNSWPGLTKEGFFPAEPQIFYPTGRRHYVRLFPTDDYQGPAGAIWAHDLGFERVYIFDDGDIYGKGIADLFSARAKSLGLAVIDQVTLDKDSTDFSAAVGAIIETEPDLVYFGGVSQHGGALLLKQMREAGLETDFMGPDGILDEEFTKIAGIQNAEGTLITLGGTMPQYVSTPAVQLFRRAYLRKFNTEPGTFSIAGYEAARVVLQGISQAEEKDRAGILEKVLNTTDFEGLTGYWGFNDDGDITEINFSGVTIKEGEYQLLRESLSIPEYK